METKERQRYILFKIISDGDFEEGQFIRALWRNLFQLYGESGTSRTGLWVTEFVKNEYGIIRTNTVTLPMVRTVLSVIRSIGGVNCILVIQGVSGTIKSLKKKHLHKIKGNFEESQ